MHLFFDFFSRILFQIKNFIMHCERANSPETSLRVFEEEIIKLGLSYKILPIGHFPETTRCWLFNFDNTLVDMGNGKGIGLQSEISAKYEALEHYLSTQKSGLKPKCMSFSLEEIEGSLSKVNRKALPSYFIKNCNRIKKTPWIFFQGYRGSSIILPYFLANLDYINKPFSFDDLDYSTFSDIPSNNGTAIGTTFEEAMIHAINELIERDSISCFLLSTFGRKNPKKIKIISKESLPRYLCELIAKIERDYAEELLIIDIATDLQFPAFLATFTKQSHPIQPMGFGTSLSSIYALERAILEALQSLHLYEEDLGKEDIKILNKFNQWPKLQKCAQCDLLPLVKASHYNIHEFRESFVSNDLFEILDETIRNLEHHNLHVFFATHYQSENGISCVKVIIPGIEQFHRVRLGNFVIPGERGIAILAQENEHD